MIEKIEKILNQIHEFPTLPTIYVTLSDIMANPRSTVEDAARLISQDQSSTSKILKAANSSIYGIRGKISTISQAIFYIGFDEVKNLVLSISIMKLFDLKNSKSSINPIDLWKHSMAVGVISRFLGRSIGIKHLEDYFISGILHDLGKMIFLKNIPEEYEEVVSFAKDNNLSLKDAETIKLGISHTVAGDILSEKWKLPKTIRNCISSHNTGVVDGSVVPLVACVHLANIITHIMEIGDLGVDYIPEPNEQIWEYLNLKEKFISNNFNTIINEYEESVNLMLYS